MIRGIIIRTITKFFCFFSIFLITLSTFCIDIANCEESYTIYHSISQDYEFKHLLNNTVETNANRIAQMNFQCRKSQYGLNLSNLGNNKYLGNQSVFIAKTIDKSIFHPTYPTYITNALNITTVNPSSEYCTIFNYFEDLYNPKNVSICGVFSGNAKSIIFRFGNSTFVDYAMSIALNFETQVLSIISYPGGVYTIHKTVLGFCPKVNTTQLNYIAILPWEGNTFDIIIASANFSGYISDNFTITEYPSSMNSLVDSFMISNVIGIGQTSYIYAIDSNLRIDSFEQTLPINYISTFNINNIDKFYYVNKQFNVSEYLVESDLNEYISTNNDSTEFYNYDYYLNYQSDLQYYINENINVNNVTINQIKNNFKIYLQISKLYPYSSVQTTFNFTNRYIRILLVNQYVYIYENVTLIGKFDSQINGYTESSIYLHFYNKQLMIVCMNSTNYNVFYFQTIEQLTEIRFNSGMYLKYLKISNSYSQIESFNNISKFRQNYVYEIQHYYDSFNNYTFNDYLYFDTLIPISNTVNYQNQIYYFEEISIAYFKFYFNRNYTIGNHRLTDSVNIYPIFTGNNTNYKLECYNHYDGLSNSSFLNSNGGILIFITYLTNPTFNFSFIKINVQAYYEFLYFTDIGLALYFDFGIQLFIPIIIVSTFAIGLYGISKNKYFGLFGFIIGLVILFLIGMISIFFLILLLFLSIFAFYMITKHEKEFS